jgi:hypothetical protein
MSTLGGMTAADGKLVAWGSVYKDSVNRAAVWQSTDGRNWDRALVGKANDWIGEVVGSESRFVAVGSGPFCCEEGATAPVKAWTSADGVTWARAEFQYQGGDLLAWVVEYGGRYVALGDAYGNPISWISNDGAGWVESESVPDAALDNDLLGCTGGPCPVTNVHDLAGGTAGLIAVGAQRLYDDEENPLGWRSVVWIAPAVEN